MADNKQNQDQNQKKNDRTNDAIGMPADNQNQRGNTNMETQGGNRAEKDANASDPSSRMDTPGNDARGENTGRDAQGGSNKPMQNESDRQGNMEKRPAGSKENEEGQEGREREKRPA